MKTYYALPDQNSTQHIFNPERSFLSIIVPKKGVNLVFDPEALAFGVGSQADYYAIGASSVDPNDLLRRRGVYGVLVSYVDSVGDGVGYNVPVTTNVDTTYSFSFDHIGQGRYKAYILDRSHGDRVMALTTFDGQAFWIRPTVTMYASFTTEPSLCVVAADAAIGEFTVDGFQFEEGQPTTFISGELREEYVGRSQYGWLGAPHNSASYRLPSARSGGDPVPLTEFGFDVTQLTDWGMPEPTHIFSNYALRNGAYYHRSRVEQREISFVGSLAAPDFRALLQGRNGLSRAMDIAENRPFRMHFQGYDCLTPTTECLEFDALYSQGLAATFSNLHEERPAVTLTMPDPYFYAYGDDAAIVELYEEVDDEGIGVVGRDADGDWRALIGASVFPADDFVVHGMCVGEDYNLYVVGEDGVGLSYVLRWDGIDWSQIGPNWDGPLYTICWGPGNTLLFAGATTNEDGEAADPGFPVWQYDLEASTVAPLGGMYFTNDNSNPDGIYSIVVHPNGYVVAGGAFTAITEDGMSDDPILNIASYSIVDDTWSPMGDGLVPHTGDPTPVGYVRAIAIGPDRSVWAGGTFDPGVTDDFTLLARWHYTTNQWYFIWDYPMEFPDASDVRALGAIYALAFSRDGKLIVGGRFDTSRGRVDEVHTDLKPLVNLAIFTPSAALADDYAGQMKGMQYGTNETASATRTSVYAVVVDCNNVAYVGGTFTQIRVLLPEAGSGTFALTPVSVDGMASFDVNGNFWMTPEISIDPAVVFGGLPGVAALAVGGNCNQNRGSGVLGQISAGNATLTELGIGVAPGADNTVFAGAYMDLGANIPIINVVDTGCAVDTRPIIKFKGPGILYSIENFTNSSAIIFDRVALMEDGLLTVDLSRIRPAIFTAGGNTSGLLARGSGLSAFRLTQGENRIKVIFRALNDTNESGARTVTMQWRPKYTSIDALGGC